MQRALTLYESSIGKKVAMAASGIVIVGFSIGHMLGNLQVYLGPEPYNAYAEALKGNLPLLWGTRIVLLLAFGAHIYTGIQLGLRKKAARPVRYKNAPNIEADFASKSMYLSGPLLLLFLIFHLLTLTLGVTFGALDFDAHDAYTNMVGGFTHVWVSGLYIVSMVALGLHLFHGVFSIFQSLGLNHPRYNAFRRDLAIGVATLVTLGNISFPVAVLTGNLTL